MSDPGSSTPASRRAMVKPGLLVVVRILLSVSVLFAAYYLLPIRNKGQGSDVPFIKLGPLSSTANSRAEHHHLAPRNRTN